MNSFSGQEQPRFFFRFCQFLFQLARHHTIDRSAHFTRMDGTGVHARKTADTLFRVRLPRRFRRNRSRRAHAYARPAGRAFFISFGDKRRNLERTVRPVPRQGKPFPVLLWLRMNASYRLNTCKSRGSMSVACNR